MLIVSCMAVALVVAAMAALYSALPQIAVATGATQAQLTWIVDGYTLVLACFVLPAGAIGDRYGRRGVLVAGLALFAFASALPLFLADPARSEEHTSELQSLMRISSAGFCLKKKKKK